MIYFCSKCRIKLEKRKEQGRSFHWCPKCGRCYFKKDLENIKVEKVFLTSSPINERCKIST